MNIVWRMDFSTFPFDINHINFRLFSFTFLNNKVMFLTNTSTSPYSQLNRKKIRNYGIAMSYLEIGETRVESWEVPGNFYSVPGFNMTSRAEKYLWVYYLPTSLFTLISWFSFHCLPGQDGPARHHFPLPLWCCILPYPDAPLFRLVSLLAPSATLQTPMEVTPSHPKLGQD